MANTNNKVKIIEKNVNVVKSQHNVKKIWVLYVAGLGCNKLKYSIVYTCTCTFCTSDSITEIRWTILIYSMTNLVYMSPREYLLAVAIGTEKKWVDLF